MKTSRLGILAAVAVFALGAFLAAAPSAAGKDHPNPVRKAMARTQKVLAHAYKAVKSGSAGKAAYRNAWLHQRAAWKALKHNKHALAARLTLLARGHARKALEANSAKMSEEESKDTPEETTAAGAATEAEAAAAVKEEEAKAPTEEEVLKEEPKAEE